MKLRDKERFSAELHEERKAALIRRLKRNPFVRHVAIDDTGGYEVPVYTYHLLWGVCVEYWCLTSHLLNRPYRTASRRRLI